MIDQFYAVMDDKEQYMYRSGLVWRGTSFPRATGCTGTLDKAQFTLKRILESQAREVARIVDTSAHWAQNARVDQEYKDRHVASAKVRAEDYGSTTYKIVKIVVDIA